MGIGNNRNKYRTNTPLEERKTTCKFIIDKYNGERIPIIIQKDYREKNIEEASNIKYLSSYDMTFSQIMLVLRKKIKNIDSTIAIYLFTENGTIINSQEYVSTIYDKFKDEDGFLYLFYTGENTFG